MARLGELLVAARLLTTEQVEQALRAQVMWGGRVGTALVELGFIDLDGLTRALGRKHGMPAALARHFDKADRALQAKLPAALAGELKVVPLLRVAGGKLAIAAIDPLAKPVRARIAEAMGVAVAEVVLSIAAEQRLMYQLEHVYGIPRSARFLRVQGPSATPFPQLGEVPVPIDSDPEISVPVVRAPPMRLPTIERDAVPEPIDSAELSEPAPVEDLSAMIEQAMESATTPPHDEPAGRDRRSYVRTLADDEAAATTALGRIAIKTVAVETGSLPVIEEATVATNVAEAVRAIKRAAKRDRVAELVIDALVRFAPECDAAMMMFVRGGAAIGWRWFCRRIDPPTELAVPAGEAGLVAAAIAQNQTSRTPLAELGMVDTKLVAALGAVEGELVVVPVPIANRVMCVVAATVRSDAPLETLETVAAAASAAFARLVRDASR